MSLSDTSFIMLILSTNPSFHQILNRILFFQKTCLPCIYVLNTFTFYGFSFLITRNYHFPVVDDKRLWAEMLASIFIHPEIYLQRNDIFYASRWQLMITRLAGLQLVSNYIMKFINSGIISLSYSILRKA